MEKSFCSREIPQVLWYCQTEIGFCLQMFAERQEGSNKATAALFKRKVR